MSDEGVLDQFISVTALSTQDDSTRRRAKALLDAADGDLEAAVTLYLDHGLPADTANIQEEERVVEREEEQRLLGGDPIQESEQRQSPYASSGTGGVGIGGGGGSGGGGMGGPSPLNWFYKAWFRIRTYLRLPLLLITLPLSLTLSLLSLIARVLHIRPNLPTLTLRPPFSPPNATSDPRAARRNRERSDPKLCAERWVRGVQELAGVGLYDIGVHGRDAKSTSVGEREGAAGLGKRSNAGMGDGEPSGSGSGSRGLTGLERALPEFEICSYHDAVEKAKQEARILMVVLDSVEHEHSLYFKRHVLADPELVDLLKRNKILCWGGTVTDPDAQRAAQILDAFVYPTVVFLSLQPNRRSPPSGSSLPSNSSSTLSPPPVIVPLSRLHGSPHSSLSSSTLMTHISQQLLPRIPPYLDRVRADRRRLLEERRERERQDRVYEDAQRRDADRIRERRAERERKEREAKQKEERAQRASERKEERKRQLEKRKRWRSWVKERIARGEEAGVLKPQPEGKQSAGKTVRLAFRVGEKRLVRSFDVEDPIEALYVYVDAFGGPTSELVGDAQVGLDEHEHEFNFNLATAWPKKVLGATREERKSAIGETLMQVTGKSEARDLALVVEGDIELAEEEDEEDEEGEA